MLAGDVGVAPISPIVVGRVLSAYAAGDVQGGQETITYTVYNEQANPETNVLLSTTLPAGVTFVSSSLTPGQTGSNLTWSLGTIAGNSRASVSVTVALAGPNTLTLDGGVFAGATLDGAAVSDVAPAATLRAGTVDASLLASTPDANTTDPYVQQKAAELDYDTAKIFAFVRDQIGYESYTGSLRGARGTLWSGAGNSLDKASLLVALLRASGTPSRYAQGTLSQDLSRQLTLSMFPNHFRILGIIDPGTVTSDPANDFQLLSEAGDHNWVELDSGGGFQAADPDFASAQLGQTFTDATSTFAEVPDARRHKVEVTLNAETSSAAGNLFGLGPSRTTVLEQTFNTVDLVGRSLSIGNFVKGSGIGTPIFSSKTYTYSPYIVVNQNDGNVADDPLFRGTDYQEVLTNFPLGSQFLTGLFLDVTTIDPADAGQMLFHPMEKTLVDRIGFAARQGGSGSAINLDGNAPPALSNLDITTLTVSTSLEAGPTPIQTAALNKTQADLAAVKQQLDGPNPTTDLAATSASLSREAVLQSTALVGQSLFVRSDHLAQTGLDPYLLVRDYFDSPRIVAVTSRVVTDTDTKVATTSVGLDILRDLPRSEAPPGQAVLANSVLVTGRTLADSEFEAQIAESLAASGAARSSAFDVFSQALESPGASPVYVGRSNISVLPTLGLSAEALARTTQSVQQGKVVVLVVGAPAPVA